MLLTVPVLYYKPIQERALKIKDGRREGVEIKEGRRQGGGGGARISFRHKGATSRPVSLRGAVWKQEEKALID